MISSRFHGTEDETNSSSPSHSRMLETSTPLRRDLNM